ncbi:hypothetical protein MDAP_001457 [Mitosporidium daphniae]
MPLEAWIYLLSLILAALLLFAMVFFIILFSDLECDYVNPIDLCTNLNQFVIPEYLIHALCSISLFMTGSIFASAWNIPLLSFHAYRIYTRTAFFDATEIFHLLNRHKRESFIKLGFYLFSFFLYLYKLIASIIK